MNPIVVTLLHNRAGLRNVPGAFLSRRGRHGVGPGRPIATDRRSSLFCPVICIGRQHQGQSLDHRAIDAYRTREQHHQRRIDAHRANAYSRGVRVALKLKTRDDELARDGAVDSRVADLRRES
jgi:hypothetical protein